ncbi:MAG: DMT family transporter [bacterium]|nr:DMT family transporter [bacterium]
MKAEKFPERTRAVMILMAGAFGISFSPVLAKLVGQDAIGPTAIGFWRTIIGGLVMMLIVLFQRQRLLISKVPIGWCIFGGLFFALDLAFWHRAILDIGAGMATLLGNTQVFITTVASFLIFKEKLTRRFLMSVPVAFFGLVLLIGVLSESVPFTGLYVRGLVFGFLTAVSYAFYMVGLKKATSHSTHPSPSVLLTWVCFSSALFTAIGSVFESQPFMPPDFRAFSIVLALGIFCQALSWWAIAYGVKRVAIHHAGLILLMQPPLSILWGFLFFGETLVFSQIIGAVITLSAIYAGSMKAGKRKLEKQQKQDGESYDINHSEENYPGHLSSNVSTGAS